MSDYRDRLIERCQEFLLKDNKKARSVVIAAEEFADFIMNENKIAAHRCASIIEGKVVFSRYREWPEVSGQGNRDNDNPLVRHCDRLASAIRNEFKIEGK